MDLKQDVTVWSEFVWLKIEASGEVCEPSGSIKGGEFID
jgi:hypothetical protein